MNKILVAIVIFVIFVIVPILSIILTGIFDESRCNSTDSESDIYCETKCKTGDYNSTQLSWTKTYDVCFINSNSKSKLVFNSGIYDYFDGYECDTTLYDLLPDGSCVTGHYKCTNGIAKQYDPNDNVDKNSEWCLSCDSSPRYVLAGRECVTGCHGYLYRDMYGKCTNSCDLTSNSLERYKNDPSGVPVCMPYQYRSKHHCDNGYGLYQTNVQNKDNLNIEICTECLDGFYMTPDKKCVTQSGCFEKGFYMSPNDKCVDELGCKQTGFYMSPDNECVTQSMCVEKGYLITVNSERRPICSSECYPGDPPDKLHQELVNGKCEWVEVWSTEYNSCSNGSARQWHDIEKEEDRQDINIELCAFCDDGYHLKDKLCVQDCGNSYLQTLEGGKSICKLQCRDYTHHSNINEYTQMCIDNQYSCENGIANSVSEYNKPLYNNELSCSSCNSGYILHNKRCITQDEYSINMDIENFFSTGNTSTQDVDDFEQATENIDNAIRNVGGWMSSWGA